MAGLEKFAENVWTIDGPSVHFMGLAFPTRMIIVARRWFVVGQFSRSRAKRSSRRHQGFGSREISRGPDEAPRWRLEEGHELFPDATMWGPPQIPKEFKRLRFAGILGDEPPVKWADDLDQLVFKGNLVIEEVFFFHKSSRTLMVADFIQNHRTTNGKVFQNTLVKLGGVAYRNGGVPRDVRLIFTNRNLARRSLEKVLSWDFDKLLIAHGVRLAGNAKRFVKDAFRWLVAGARN